MFIEEGLGVVVNTPCTIIWEKKSRVWIPLLSHAVQFKVGLVKKKIN